MKGIIEYFLAKMLVLIAVFMVGVTVSYAQPSGVECVENAAPGETACLATPICDLNGYCGRTLSSYTADAWQELKDAIKAATIDPWGIDWLTIENDSYLKFVAGSSTISFDLYVYDCLGAGSKAIQVVFFSAENCGSGLVNVIYTHKELPQQNAPHSITVNNMIPGDTYYILIDGYSNKNCGYSFVATSGIQVGGMNLDFSPSSTVCIGESVEVQVSGGDGTYTWSGASGLSANSGSTVEITPPSVAGTYNYTVETGGGTSGDIVCPGAQELAFTITVTDNAEPLFTNPGPVCVGQPFTLPTTSNNGVGGTWSPAINTQETTEYLFTPNNLSCSSPVYMTVEVSTHIAPLFTNPGPICLGETFTLPAVSNNGVSGTWSPQINLTETTSYQFTPINQDCASIVEMTVVVTEEIVPLFEEIGPFCSGATFSLPTTSTNGVTGTWTPQVNNQETMQYTFTPNTSVGCATGVSLTVVITPSPIADFSFNPELLDEENSYVDFTNESQGGSIYFWNFGDNLGTSNLENPSYSYEFNGMDSYHVSLTVTNDEGCENSISKVILVNLPEMSVEFPNVFTPNGDGFNDNFIFVNYQNVESIDLIILNRWGNVVFESNELDFSWNGRIHNIGAECNDGVYFYKANLIGKNGEEEVAQGYVHLIKRD